MIRWSSVVRVFALCALAASGACSAFSANSGSAADGGSSPTYGGADMGAVGGGSFGNVGIGGGQDFAAFRAALDKNLIPSPSTLDSGGFFAEHYTSLPIPSCGETFCLHALLSVAPDLVAAGTRTLVQLGMNSPIDPDTVQKPPLDLVVVLDRSGSMQDASSPSPTPTSPTISTSSSASSRCWRLPARSATARR